VADGVRQKFTGYERDTETGLDFAQARYYANVQGRFTTVDPFSASGIASAPQSWNRYSYTVNSPLVYVDPSGLIWGKLETNGGDRYIWYKDQAALEAAGATVISANASNNSNAFIYEGIGDAYVRLDLSANSWYAYETSGEAHLGHTAAQGGFTTEQSYGLTLSTVGVVQGGFGLAKLGGTALSRIFTGAGSEITTLSLSGGTNAAQSGAGLSMEGMAFELRFLQRHLPGTAQAERLVTKEGAVHVFNDLSTISRVESDLFVRGLSTGTVRGYSRVGLRFEQPIGFRVGQDGARTALNYAEMKIRSTSLYHIIPRTGPSH
jgi:RHS repeat-associated protein